MVRQVRQWGGMRLEKALGVLTDTDLSLRSSSKAPAHAMLERAFIRISMMRGRNKDRLCIKLLGRPTHVQCESCGAMHEIGLEFDHIKAAAQSAEAQKANISGKVPRLNIK